MTLRGPVFFALRSLVRGGPDRLLTSRDWLVLATIAMLGAISFVFEGFGLFGLMSMAFGGSRRDLTLGLLLGVPATDGVLGAKISASWVFGFVLARMILNPVLNYRLAAFGEMVSHRLRARLLSMAAALPAINAGAIPSGELATIINQETGRCGRALYSMVGSVQLIVGVLLSVVFLVARDPKLNLVAILSATPALGLYAFLAARSSKDSRRVVDAHVRAGAQVTEGLRALAGIQAAGGSSGLAQTFAEAAEEIRKRETRIYFNQGVLQGATALVPVTAAAGALLYVWHVLGVTTAQGLGALLLPTAIVGGRVAAASSSVVMNVYATSVLSTSFIPVLGLLERLTKLSRRNAADRETDRGANPQRLQRLEIRGCSFQLPNRVWLFRDLSISAEANHPIVVRGASGTGKSTLASVVAGSNDVAEGSIVYVASDGSEILPGERYTNYLSQDPAVMAGTVKQNLLLGNTDPIDDAVLVAALERVRLWPEFEANGGLASPVFEGGRNLSGGQVRRLGLARLLARDRDLWIFDEATASLDPVSQEIVESFIRDIAASRIVLVITHDEDFQLAGSREIQLFHNSSARLIGAA
jgi:ABC-type transport system involved in cytochrome bd biosynthesis fused ATPase/permease subunit